MADVVVIGGGPAGAAAARLLAQWGHAVEVRTRAAAAAALAESIPPTTRKLFDTLGVTAAVDRAGFVRTTGNTVWWGGEERCATFPDGQYGYQVERTRFDALLLRLARDAGARIRQEPVTRKPDAPWVLDCSGRAGVLARHGYRRSTAPRTLALVANWERVAGWSLPDESHTLVESCERGWAWSVPVSPTRRCIAFMLDPRFSQIEGRAQLATHYRQELVHTHRMRALVENAVLLARPWACDASAYDASRVSDDGVLLVGDAASFVDPLSSYGVKKALASAWLAAVVVNTCLTDPEVRTAALQFYERRERVMFEQLQRQYAEFANRAVAQHGADFWFERTAPEATPGGTPDIAQLRRDPAVLAAFESLKQRDSIRLRHGDAVQRAQLPVVRGNRIVLATHLVAPPYPDGIRYVRDVDLVKLCEIAPEHEQVPDLCEAYNRAAPPVALPDLLGALSMSIAKGLLQHA